jgi:hypothetical protein
LLEVVHQFCLWEEEKKSLATLPQLEESKAVETLPSG